MTRPTSAPIRMRRLMERAALVVIFGIIGRTWYVEGLLIPYRVSSGSMAETLAGPRFEIVCGDCGTPFACDATAPAMPNRAVCPNCGFAQNRPQFPEELAGDRLLVGKSIFQLRPPRRWEVVAFGSPSNAARVAVKRVVGLPGESVAIRDGDVYVDGRIQRKPAAQQRALAVPVYDADRPPKQDAALPPRWHGDCQASQWSQTAGRFRHPASARPTEIDWLGYHHWRRIAGQPGKVQYVPITNECGYNQPAMPRQAAYPVRDVLLAVRVLQITGTGDLMVRAADGRKTFQLSIDPNRGEFRLFENGQPLPGRTHADALRRLAGKELEVWLVDSQLTLLVDGVVLFKRPYTPAAEVAEVPGEPLAIGVRGLGVELSALRVSRDVYYTRPPEGNARWGLDKPAILGKAEYFVLGDNSQDSLDSRSWLGGPGVPAELLVGKPIWVHVPSMRVVVRGRQFQVPDLARIRYIR